MRQTETNSNRALEFIFRTIRKPTKFSNIFDLLFHERFIHSQPYFYIEIEYLRKSTNFVC